MKWRHGTSVLFLVLAACGGGGGGGGSSISAGAITVTSAKSPVLVTYTSNTVQATFSSPATVPDGTQVNFTASSPNVTLIPPKVTVAAGVATIRVKSSAPGKYLITATGSRRRDHLFGERFRYIHRSAHQRGCFRSGSA